MLSDNTRSFSAQNAPSLVSELSAIEDYYAELSSVMDAVPKIDFLGDFNVASGASMGGYEVCIAPRGSGNFSVRSETPTPLCCWTGS